MQIGSDTLHQNQMSMLFESWYQEHHYQQSSTSNSNSHQISSQNNPVDLILRLSIPMTLDIRSSWSKAQSVSVETLQWKKVLFDVSLSQSAKIIFDMSSSHDVLMILCSLSQSLSEECFICRDTLTSEKLVSLACETCWTDVHLYCMKCWLRSGPISNSYCPVW